MIIEKDKTVTVMSRNMLIKITRLLEGACYFFMEIIIIIKIINEIM